MDYRENRYNSSRLIKFQASEYSDRIRNLNKLEDRILGDRIKQIEREKRFSINLINREIRLTEKDLEAKQETLQALYNKEKLKILHENLHIVLLAKERLNEKIRMNNLRYQSTDLTSQQSMTSMSAKQTPQAKSPTVRFNTRVSEVASASTIRSKKESIALFSKRAKSAKASIAFAPDLATTNVSRTTTTPISMQNQSLRKSARSLNSGTSQRTGSSPGVPVYLPEMPLKRSKSNISLEKMDAAGERVERKRSTTVVGKNLIRPRAQVVNPENRLKRTKNQDNEFMKPSLSRSVETMSISTSSSRQSMYVDGMRSSNSQEMPLGAFSTQDGVDDFIEADLDVQEIDVESIADDDHNELEKYHDVYEESEERASQRSIRSTPRIRKNTPRYLNRPKINDDNDVIFSPRPTKDLRKRQNPNAVGAPQNQLRRNSNRELVHVQNMDGGLILRRGEPKTTTDAKNKSKLPSVDTSYRNGPISSPTARNTVGKRK